MRRLRLSGSVAVAGSVQIRMRSNFDIKWFQIAVSHDRLAIEARERAVAAEDGSQEMAEAFDDELQATMVVVAAAAFAIDALYVKVDELGKRTAKWQEEIPELFGLRDELVHFRGEDHESQPHPTGKSHVSMENSVYTVESATWAVDLALEVLTIVYSSPRKKYAALFEWSENTAHVPPWLERLRRGEHE
jgi:hypothetical protein